MTSNARRYDSLDPRLKVCKWNKKLFSLINTVLTKENGNNRFARSCQERHHTVSLSTRVT